MIVQALQLHRSLGEIRKVGAIYDIPDHLGSHLRRAGLVRKVMASDDWYVPRGRELRTERLIDQPWPQVVACLNIWNDLPALQETLPTWIDKVDMVVVGDGQYGGEASTDGLIDWLREAVGKKSLYAYSGTWTDQNAKRTDILRTATAAAKSEGHHQALLLVIDADEYLSAEVDLHQLPEGDVLWIVLQSTSYRRPYGQPRLFRARPDLHYRGRHHWLYAGERLVATHQYGAPGWEHRLAPVFLRNQRGLGQAQGRQQAKQAHLTAQAVLETVASTGLSPQSDGQFYARESLQIMQLTTYDPGMVGFRLHTAINTTTPHASLFFRRGRDNPFHAPRQYDVDLDPAKTKRLLQQADVVHCHLNYAVLDSLQVKPRRLVIHHHGTVLRRQAGLFAKLDQRACLRLVSNLELLSYGEDLKWLPNPVSVARLRRLREQVLAARAARGIDVDEHGGILHPTFRVAHSPSKRHLKGTEDFLEVCKRLFLKGLSIEPVLIEGKTHEDSLRIKARCDACFDSFWLGLQCSGIEAAGMGLPVLAGDPTVRERYERLLGDVPYTFVADPAELEMALERLITDAEYRAAQARGVAQYVEQWHDDAAVALRYLDLLDEAIGWRQTKAVTKAKARSQA